MVVTTAKHKDAFDGLRLPSERSPAPTLGDVQRAGTGTSARGSGPLSSSANLTIPSRGTTYVSAGSSPRPSPSPWLSSKGPSQRRLLRRPSCLHSPLSRRRSQMHPRSTFPWSSCSLLLCLECPMPCSLSCIPSATKPLKNPVNRISYLPAMILLVEAASK